MTFSRRLKMEPNYCVHPGTIIKSILMSIDKTQQWLADEMGVKKTIISDLVRGKRNVTANLAKEIEKATGYKAKYLLAQQNEYDLFVLRQEEEKRAESIKYSANNNSFGTIFALGAQTLSFAV